MFLCKSGRTGTQPDGSRGGRGQADKRAHQLLVGIVVRQAGQPQRLAVQTLSKKMANRVGRGRRGCAATAPALRLGGSSAAFGWSLLARAAVLLVAFGAPGCLGVLRRLGSTSDAVVASDIEAGGPCEGGCVRTVVDAEVYAIGEVDCELRVENFLDHTDEDVVGGSLNVVHSCTNADGDLMYQVRVCERKKYFSFFPRLL